MWQCHLTVVNQVYLVTLKKLLIVYLKREVDLIMMNVDYVWLIKELGVYNRLLIAQIGWGKPISNILFHCLILPIYCLFKNYDYVFFPAGNRRFPFGFLLKQ